MRKFAAFLGILFLTGCATIVDGTKQQVTFQSEPMAVDVYVDGQLLGQTPLTVDVKRKNSANVEFRKDGFKSQSIQMTSKLNTTFWGNVIIGGLPGSTTDGASGAAREYAPGTYYVKLEQE